MKCSIMNQVVVPENFKVCILKLKKRGIVIESILAIIEIQISHHSFYFEYSPNMHNLLFVLSIY